MTLKELELLELQRQNKARQVTIIGVRPAAPDPIDASLARLKQTLAGITPVSDSEASAREREAKAADLRLHWNAPRRHVEKKDLDPNAKEWFATLEKLSSRIGTGFLMALVGPRGPGKTQLAVALMEATVQKLRSAYYLTAMDFFLAVKATYKQDSQSSEADAIRSFCKHRLLVIDEMQDRGESQWENRMLGYLVNRRYNDMADTLLIANLTVGEFSKAMGSSITSRLNETGGIIECAWKSFRD